MKTPGQVCLEINTRALKPAPIANCAVELEEVDGGVLTVAESLPPPPPQAVSIAPKYRPTKPPVSKRVFILLRFLKLKAEALFVEETSLARPLRRAQNEWPPAGGHSPVDALDQARLRRATKPIAPRPAIKSA